VAVVDEIKQRLDIVDLVSQYVNLQKVGKNYRGLCPFHAERNPSFYVFPERQSWFCFGQCHTGGDIFSFVMKKENLSFAEALRLLAEKAGVRLEGPRREEAGEVRRLYEVNEAAARFYHRQLLDTAEAAPVRRYLKERGIAPETVLDFELGYSPREGNALRRHLLSLGYSAKEMEEAGLVREGGQDLFRRRIIFPIRDARGRVVGFGGRALDDTPPKYLNSPTTPIFSKGAILYGMDRAREAISRENRVIIVEGYFDVIVAHQSGFKNTVGTLGVALTERQLHSLKNYTRNLILALDPDPAGIEATLRGVEVAGRTLSDRVRPIPDWRGVVRFENILNAEIKVLALPQGKDPDDIIKERPEIWRRLVEEAVPVLDFLLETLTAGHDLSQVKEKIALVQRLKPLFQQVKDPIKLSHYTQKLSQRLKMEQRFLLDALKAPEGKAETASVYLPSTHSLEEECLSLLFGSPELRGETAELEPDCFQESVNRELFLIWRDCSEPEKFKERLEPWLREYVEGLVSRPLPPLSPEEKREVLKHCIGRLKENYLRQRLRMEEELLAQGGEPEAFSRDLEGLRKVLKRGGES